MRTSSRRRRLAPPWVHVERLADDIARAVGSWAETSARGLQERLDALNDRGAGNADVDAAPPEPPGGRDRTHEAARMGPAGQGRPD